MPDNTDTRLYDFVQNLVTSFMEKLSTVTAAINDFSNQLKALSVLQSQTPTRLDLLDKLSDLIENSNDKIIIKIEQGNKNQDETSDQVCDNSRDIQSVTLKIDKVLQQVEDLTTIVKMIHIISKVLIFVVPIVWAGATWVTVVIHNSPKK